MRYRYIYKYKTGMTKVKTRLAIAITALGLGVGGVIGSVAIFGAAHAAQPNMPASMHFGPIASDSPDSGTCDNTWAQDTMDRVYTVNTRQNKDGTYSVTEEFKNGSFVTNDGASPGGCETNLGGILTAGIRGKMQGSFNITVSNGTFNASGECTDSCYTADFVKAYFGDSATYDVPSYNVHYNAGALGDWKNASSDRGGDIGDISNYLQ